MRYVAVLPIEGVLSQSDDLGPSHATKWGRLLFESLKAEYRVILLTKAEEDLARWWLSKEFMEGYSSIKSYVEIMPWPEWRIDQVRQLLADGFEFGMVLDTDDSVVHGASMLGVVSLRLLPPQRPSGWREHTTEVRPWNQVAGTVESW